VGIVYKNPIKSLRYSCYVSPSSRSADLIIYFTGKSTSNKASIGKFKIFETFLKFLCLLDKAKTKHIITSTKVYGIIVIVHETDTIIVNNIISI
jgi:hypothetical protein